MSKSNSQTAHAWAHHTACRGSHLTSDGITLTSYSTPIATHLDGIIYISKNSMSPSTSKHISEARRAVGYSNENIFYTRAFSYGERPYYNHANLIGEEAEATLKDLETCLAGNHREKTKLDAICIYTAARNYILDFASRLNVTIFMPEYTASPEEVKNYVTRKAAELEAKEAAAQKARDLQQKKDKAQFDRWIKGEAVAFPRSFYVRGSDFFTLRGETVVTSQGAECPADHAVKALKFWQSKICYLSTSGKVSKSLSFTPYQTNGHTIHLGIFKLESISETGEVKAGCHTFTAATIQAFIKRFGKGLEI